MLALIENAPPPDSLQRQADRLKASLEKKLEEIAIRTGRQAPPASPWEGYELRPIAIDGRGPFARNLLWMEVDGDDLVLIWGRPIDGLVTYTFTRLPADGGTLRPVASLEKVAALQITSVAAGGDALFVATRNSGLVIVRRDQVAVLTEANGLPAEGISDVAWLAGQVYLGFPGALARFDPDDGSLELLASSRSVESRHDLDGGQPYHVAGLVADAERECLWVGIGSGHDAQRNGVWRYTPADRTLQRVVRTNPSARTSLRPMGSRLFVYAHDADLFDPADETLDRRPGYPRLHLVSQPKSKVLIGDHLITTTLLATADGRSWPIPRFQMIEPFADGFIGMRRTGELWFVQRRR